MRARSILAIAFFLSGLGAEVHAQTHGLTERVPNSSLRMPQSPPVFGFATSNAFPGLSFGAPVAITTPPGETNRVFVVEKNGRIIVIPDLTQPGQSEVFLDISGTTDPSGEGGLLGLAFHPNYLANRYFFIFRTLNTSSTNHITGNVQRGFHERLSRMEIDPSNPNRALPNSEVPLINQFDQASNHNGGDLHFGPDGYLYVGLGDEGGGGDNYQNSQKIDNDFFSGMLRIDVDSRPENLAPNPHGAVFGNYRVPADNPFVNAYSFNERKVAAQQVRTEFWAVGLRNPWRFSFDPPTGLLYCGDVGQGAVEEINIITKGGNYGWSFREGNRSYPFSGGYAQPASAVFLPPILEVFRSGSATNIGSSITGGVVYRGTRIAQLTGNYVFADYVSGNIWALRYDGSSAKDFRHLATDGGTVAFGTDPSNGDVLLADINAGMVKRLGYGATVSGEPLPATLADTGAFADPATLTPNPGVVPYDVNVAFWSDGALKTRWFSVPSIFPGPPEYFNTETITIADNAIATPYPSIVPVSGLQGVVSNITVTVKGFTHAFPDDVDILLVSPDGTSVVVMSDAGGGAALDNLTFSLDDGAARPLPDDQAIEAGTYRPSDYSSVDDLPLPAPPQPYFRTLSEFNGIDPNGNWALYVVDDATGQAGQIVNGWSMAVATRPNTPPTISAIPNQRTPEDVPLTGVTFTVGDAETPAAGLTVTAQSSNPSLVPNESIVIGGAGESRTLSATPVAGGNGTAQIDVIVRDGAGTRTRRSFVLTVLEVFGPEAIASTEVITIPVVGQPAPYPSAIAVSGVSGKIRNIAVGLDGLTHDYPDDLDILLVGPGGQTVILMSDAGGEAPVQALSVTFDDSASLPVPDEGPLTVGPYRPSNYDLVDVFGAPAPPAPYGTSLGAFNGLDPNGQWSLFIIDDEIKDRGVLTGWRLILTTLADAPPVDPPVVDPPPREPVGPVNLLTTGSVIPQRIDLKIEFERDSNWSFPTGTVWVKHFDIEMVKGVPASSRRLETRLLVRNSAGIYGATYRWGNDPANATLVPEEGADELLEIDDGGGVIRQQVYHYPSRTECQTCHTAAGGLALGFNTAQLNRNFDYGDVVDNQIRAMDHVAYFHTNVTSFNTLRALAAADNTAYSLEYRARSYLAANCSQCHQSGASGVGTWNADIRVPLSEAGIINGPLFDQGSDPNARVVVPGAPELSMLVQRMARTGAGRMPPIDSRVVDTGGVALLTSWITQGLAGYEAFPTWQTRIFNSTTSPESAPDADPDGDGNGNLLEYLTGTNPLNGEDAWSLSIEEREGGIRIVYPRIANRGFELQGASDVAGSLWEALDLPSNAPVPSSTSGVVEVDLPFSDVPGEFYRVRIFEY